MVCFRDNLNLVWFFFFLSHAGAGSSSNRSNNASSRGNSGKKRPISPEQVLKMFTAPNYNVSTSYHVANTKPQSPPPHGPNASQSHNTSSNVHNDNLTVRTISMSRPNVTSGSPSSQGFGICVKGGADESSEQTRRTYFRFVGFVDYFVLCKYIISRLLSEIARFTYHMYPFCEN